MKFDDLFEVIGGNGAFQWSVFVQALVIAFTSVETIYMNFVGYKPEHWCQVSELQGLPHDLQKYIASPYAEGSDDKAPIYDSCRMFDLDWSQFTNDDFLTWNRSLAESNDTKACRAWVYDQSVVKASIVTEWNLVCGKQWQVDLVSTMTLTGFLFGSIFCGIVSDRYGRRVSILIFGLLKIFSCLLSAVAPVYWVLLVARFLIGISSVAVYIVVFVHMVEVTGESLRTVFGMMYHMTFGVGFAMVALFGYLVRDHVFIQLIMAVPSFIILPIVWFIPESPRWLLLQGRISEAEKILRKIAEINNKQIPENYDFSKVEIEKNKSDESKASLIDLFRNPKIRRYTLILYTIWFTVNLVYYALSLNSGSLAGDLYLNTFLLGAIEIPAQFIGLYCLDIKFLGRRWTNGLGLIVAGFVSLVNVPLLLLLGESDATTAMALLGKAGATVSFNGMYVFTSEIYPTEVRNVGLGSSSMAARVSGILAPYVGGSFSDIWLPLPSLIFGITGTISGLMTFLLPETLHKKLPETIEEVEHGAMRNQVEPAINMDTATNQAPDTKNMEYVNNNGADTDSIEAGIMPDLAPE